jgi:hypothetical protein
MLQDLPTTDNNVEHTKLSTQLSSAIVVVVASGDHPPSMDFQKYTLKSMLLCMTQMMRTTRYHLQKSKKMLQRKIITNYIDISIQNTTTLTTIIDHTNARYNALKAK